MDLSRLKIDKNEKRSRRPGFGRFALPAALVAVVGIATWLVAGPWISDFVGNRVFGAGGRVVETVRAKRLQAGQGAELTTASGYVVARQSASLGSKLLGRLAKLYVEPGDRVKENQIVAELEHEDLDATVAAAAADLARAESELTQATSQITLAKMQQRGAGRALEAATQREQEAKARLDDAARELARATGLLDAGTGSAQERDRRLTEKRAWSARHMSLVAARTEAEIAIETAKQQVTLAQAGEVVGQRQVEAAKARLAQQQALRDDAFIRAPFAGVILRKEAEVGEIVAPSPGGSTLSRSAVVTMANFATLELEVDVIERDIRLLQERGPASIRLDAYPDVPRRGVVRLIQPTADRQKATVQVNVSFAEIPEFARPEMAGSVVFLRPDAAERAEERTRILVPSRAVRRDSDGSVVWIVRGETAHRVVVRLGEPSGSDIEILDGLRGGENVIVSDAEGLNEGATVRLAKETE